MDPSSSSRIPTEIWLMAQLRAVAANGDFYTVMTRGEAQSGTVLLKWRAGRDWQLYQQNRNLDGVLGWVPLAPKGAATKVVEESWADAYIQRATARDPDLWSVEVETRGTTFPLEGPVFHDLA